MNLHFRGTRLYRPLGYLTARLAPGRSTGIEPVLHKPHFRFVGATRYRYANRAGNSLGIPGRIRTRYARFVVWNDFRFTTGTRFKGLILGCRDGQAGAGPGGCGSGPPMTGPLPQPPQSPGRKITRCGWSTNQLSYATIFLRSGTWIRTRRGGLTIHSFTS